jgi:hypothetical protein
VCVYECIVYLSRGNIYIYIDSKEKIIACSYKHDVHLEVRLCESF